MGDELLEGWEQIAKMFKVHPVTMKRRRVELANGGFIFYKMKQIGKHRCSKVACAFPSSLMRWAALKAARGEKI